MANQYIVGGRLRVSSRDSTQPWLPALSWGRSTTTETTAAYGFGTSTQYGFDNSYYYLSFYLDSRLLSTDRAVIGGRVMATDQGMTSPPVEVSRWGNLTGTEIQVFQADSVTAQFGTSYVYMSIVLATDVSATTPIVGGALTATNQGRTATPVTLESWGQTSPYVVVGVGIHGWTSQFTDSFLQQYFYLESYLDMGLTAIISDPVVTPFPSFTEGGAPAAFGAINAKLLAANVLTSVIPDTRALIAAQAAAQTTAKLGDAWTMLQPGGTGVPWPGSSSSCTEQEWEMVKAQLESEISAAQDIIPLFVSNGAFLTTVYVTNLGNIVSDLAVLELGQGQDVSLNALNILSGVVEAVASVSGLGGSALAGAIAWLVSTVVTTVAAEVEANQGTPTVSTTGARLEGDLVSWFSDAISKNTDALITVVSDSKKLAGVETLYQNGLVWPQTTTALETAATRSYELGIWHTLLPLGYAVWFRLQAGNGNSCDWEQPGTYPPGTFYWISTNSVMGGDAKPAICDKLFGTQQNQLAVSQSDVYTRVNGWNLAVYNWDAVWGGEL